MGADHISLDLEVGGLNTHVLETAAKLGAKVVWMPTLSSSHDMSIKNLAGEGITILDRQGKLLPVMDEILDIIKSYRMVLATGHISVSEAFALVDEARRKGVPKILITHALSYFSLEEQQRMAEMGAFIEHCLVALMPDKRLDPMTMVEAIKAVGAERCIMSTDFGQDHNPAPAEGMRMGIATMLRYGLTEKEVELLVKVNPAKLLGLD